MLLSSGRSALEFGLSNLTIRQMSQYTAKVSRWQQKYDKMSDTGRHRYLTHNLLFLKDI
jgi:hypothetical protein